MSQARVGAMLFRSCPLNRRGAEQLSSRSLVIDSSKADLKKDCVKSDSAWMRLAEIRESRINPAMHGAHHHSVRHHAVIKRKNRVLF